ncbi:MAG: G5 domain-containing protein [Eubacterium sp.]
MTNQSIAGKRSLRSILTTVIALVLIVATFATPALADVFSNYDVVIADNGESITVTTNETEPIEILNAAGVTLDSDDKIDISAFRQGKGGTIAIDRCNTINVEVDGSIQDFDVYADTVGQALKECGITIHSGDKLTYDQSAPVKDGMVIGIKTAFSVSLYVDGSITKLAIVEGTVGDLLALAGIELGANDYTKPSIDTPLEKDMKVKVYRVEYKELKATEAVPFSTKKINDNTMTRGKTKVITQGVDGSKEVTYKVKYVNGKEKERTQQSAVVLTEPVQKVVKVGTKKIEGTQSVKPNGVKSRNGLTVGQKISGRYTHYCACATCNGNSRGITSSGKRIRNGMSNPYYIACNWLPLGSVLRVNGHNYTVVDRGGSRLSKRGYIDIFTPEGHSACYRYGTGSCTITIVRLGW